MAKIIGRKPVCDRMRELFQTDCEVFFVFNGTAANSLALAALCQSYQAVICHEIAHVETDECGGPEFFSNGSKLLTVDGPNGKLTPDGVEAAGDQAHGPAFSEAKGAVADPVDGMRHALHGRGTAGDRGDRQAAPPERAHGRRAFCQCGRRARRATLRTSPGGRASTCCALAAPRMALPVGEAVIFFNKRPCRGFRLAGQAGGAAGLQDAVHFSAVDRACSTMTYG